MKQSDFEFTKEELVLLANVQYTALIAESKFTNDGWFWQSDEKKEANQNEILNLKEAWVDQWQKATWKLLEIENKPYTYDILQVKLIAFNESTITYDKKIIFSLECASFSAYYPLEEKDLEQKEKSEEKDKDSKSQVLDFDETQYLNKLEIILATIELPDNTLKNLKKYYKSYLNKVTSELKTAWEKWSILILTISATVVVALLTPMIAGAIGGLMGLSGIAATNAGLALLGGGSIATGGLGMAGGALFLMGGGALAGGTTGKLLLDENIKELRKEVLVISSAKLLSVVKYLAENKKINFRDIYTFLESLRNIQFKFEENLDKFVCLTETLDKEKYNNYKNNALIIGYSRKKILELLIDNKNSDA